MLNYEIDPSALNDYLPPGTELDLWNNKCYISLVAFEFLNAKLKKIRIPFYKNFEQINLRFYVRRNCNGDVRKGVVFIKEIAMGNLLKAGAALLYNEYYTNLPTRRSMIQKDKIIHFKYEWRFNKSWHYIEADAFPDKKIPAADTLEAFITERYWGYTKLSNNRTAEFRVDHPQWKISTLQTAKLNCNSYDLYGEMLHNYLSKTPVAAFVADGSFVEVHNRCVYSI
jgi:uncharacterized protein YqjF (DUF2071 family)